MKKSYKQIKFLLNKLKMSNVNDKLGFSEIINESESILNLSDNNLAASLKVSESTVRHWKDQKTYPDTLMRARVLEALLEHAKIISKNKRS